MMIRGLAILTRFYLTSHVVQNIVSVTAFLGLTLTKSFHEKNQEGIKSKRLSCHAVPRWRYHMTDRLESRTPHQPLSHALLDLNCYPTMTQAKKAIRFRKILVLRNGNTTITNEDMHLFNNATSQIDNFDMENQIVIVGQISTILQPNDFIAILTRIDQMDCYPVQSTGFVMPPFIVNQIPLPTVIYQDKDLAIVHKPEYLSTIGDTQNDLQSILPFLLSPPSTSSGPAAPFFLPRPIHRLDRRTSGLVLCAKSEQAMKQVSQMFVHRHIDKTYKALVFGQPVNRQGVIDYPVDGKSAVSVWRVVQSHNDRMTLLEIKPTTGRTHQIRRHLSYCLKTPIVGDNKYDNGKNIVWRDKGLFLCANCIALDHPFWDGVEASGEGWTISSTGKLEAWISVPIKFEAAMRLQCQEGKSKMKKDS